MNRMNMSSVQSLIYQNFLKHFELNNNKFEVDSFSIHELFIKFESRIV